MIFKKELTDSHINTFKKRVRVMLATEEVVITEKCLEVLYWIIHFTVSGKEYKNANRLHLDVALKMGSFTTYIAAYVVDQIVPKKLLKREEYIREASGLKVIKGYIIPKWLLTVYNDKVFKIDLTLMYE